MKTNESKYFYTANLMNQALILLLEKKDIDFISVTEITKKAGVSRSTFYLHYDSIYDLLEETIENLNRRFVSSFNLNQPIEIKRREDAFLITEEFLIPYLDFVKENRRVLKLVRRMPKLFEAKKTYERMYEYILYPAISMFLSEENDRTYMLEFFTGGVTSIVHKWIDLDCKTEISEIVRIIKACVKH